MAPVKNSTGVQTQLASLPMPMRDASASASANANSAPMATQLTRCGHHNHQQNQAYNFYARIDALQQACGFGRVFGGGRVF